MYDIADNNLESNDRRNSDDECEILEVKVNRRIKPEIECFATDTISRSSVVAGRKRPATDSQNSSREATRYKQPALTVADNADSPIPVPTTSQSLVQSSISSTALLFGQSSQPLPQVPDYSIEESPSCSMGQSIPTTTSTPYNGTQCAHCASFQNTFFSPLCGCTSLARPIPMRPTGIMTFCPGKSSMNSGELSVSDGLEANPSQPIHDFPTLSSPTLSQFIQSCVTRPFVRTQCVQGSTLLGNFRIGDSSRNSPDNNSSSPQTNLPQEALEHAQSSISQANTVLSITQTSQENNNSMRGGPAALEVALDLSSPLHESYSRATVIEKRPIWQGTLHYEEKGMNLSDPNVSHYLTCTFSDLSKKNNDTDLDVNLWPTQMQLSLIASEILKEKNMLEVLKKAAHHVNISFHEESHVLKRIKRNMNYGWMGCVQFTIPNDVRIMIVLYMPQKNVFVGFIPHEQKVFFHTFRHVYEKKRRLRNIQKELRAKSYPASQSASSSATSVGNEPTRNQFEEIDNEIDAHISALRHQESQPSTSYQQPGSSHSTSNSIEARLKRLEAAQNGNTRNVNVYEEIDNEINRQIAEHWLRHHSKDRSSPTPLQTTVSYPLPNVSYATPSSQLFTEELMRRNKTWLPRPKFSPGTFRPYCLLDTLGSISGEGTNTASQGTNIASQDTNITSPGINIASQSTNTANQGINTAGQGTSTNSASQGTQSVQETPTNANANSAEAQASEIFGHDLVQKVVQKRLTATGKRFYTVEELCDEILKHEESKPKPVEEGSKKDVPEELLCKICLDQRLSIVFEPCGHLATCQECSKTLTKCPMCRTYVRNKMRIYM